MGDLPYDPKWPGGKPDWDEEYELLIDVMRKGSPLWKEAFYEIVKADQRGEFAHLRTFHKQTQRELGIWVWRWALWEVHCRPIFDRPKSKDWPLYAQTVAKAVATDMSKELVAVQRIEGIPDAWRQDYPRMWTFKTTVLLIAGLIEGWFRVSPVEVLASITRFVDEQTPVHLKGALQPLVATLSMESLFAVSE